MLHYDQQEYRPPPLLLQAESRIYFHIGWLWDNDKYQLKIDLKSDIKFTFSINLNTGVIENDDQKIIEKVVHTQNGKVTN